MPINISPAFLNAIHTPLFTSPIDGKDYTVTNAAVTAAKIHRMLMSGLREQSPQVFVKARQIEHKAFSADVAHEVASATMRDVLAAQAKLAFESVKDGVKESKTLRGARHALTDVLEVLDPEAHAAYRAAKYQDGVQTDESRAKATTAAYVRLLELTFIPGLV